MTEHGHNFIREIAEAYRALEMEPQYQDRLQEAERQSKRDGETIARLELRVMEMKVEQDELSAKLRSVEAERDEAGFRQLEADDKVINLLSLLRGIQNDVGKAIAAATGSDQDQTVMMSRQDIDEYKAYQDHLQWKAAEEARQAEAKRLADEAEVERLKAEALAAEQAMAARSQSDLSPTGSSASDGSIDNPFEGSGGGLSEPVSVPVDPIPAREPQTGTGTVSTASSSEGGEVPQSLPTVSSIADSPRSSESQSQTASSTSAVAEVSAALQGGQPPQPSGPYVGKRYADWPYYVSLQGWLSGGGTVEDYTWKPSQATA